MSKSKFKIRDLLAFPFLMLAIGFDWLGLYIGGRWTVEIYISYIKSVAGKIQEKELIKASSDIKITL